MLKIAFIQPHISAKMCAVMTDSAFQFSHAEKGMTRFPPNIEQITIEREPLRTWLITRRNDVTLRFPLTEADCQYLAKLLVPGTQ
jgi:hypothetical protein